MIRSRWSRVRVGVEVVERQVEVENKERGCTGKEEKKEKEKNRKRKKEK